MALDGGLRVNSRGTAKRPVTMAICLCCTFFSIGCDNENAARQEPAAPISVTSEQSIRGVKVISPVSDSNFDSVINDLRQRGSLRPMTAAESRSSISTTPPGVYFFAYGFQLNSAGEPIDFIASPSRGAERHQFELHKDSDNDIALLGFAKSRDVRNLAYQGAGYQPQPELIPLPVDDYDSLLIVPLRMLDEMIYEKTESSVGEVAILKTRFRSNQENAS